MMLTRSIFAVFALACPAAIPLWAEDFRAVAPVTDATVYPNGATLTRRIEIDLPAGQHRVLFPFAHDATRQGPPRITAEGSFTLGAIEQLSGYITDPEAVFSSDQAAALAEVKAAEAVLTATGDEIAAARVALSSALATLEFLKTISGSGLETIDPESLQSTALMIGAQIGAAEEQRQTAERALRALQDKLEEQRKAVTQAQADLARLAPPQGAVDMLAVSVDLKEPGPVVLMLKHLTPNARWQPDYDMHLTSGDAPSLDVERKVVVQQYTGELWRGVALTLSTADPAAALAPQPVYGSRAGIYDNNARKTVRVTSAPSPRYDKAEGDMVLSEAAPAPVVLEAGLKIDGLSVTYDYPSVVTVSPRGEALVLSLGSFALEPELSIRAAPRYDKTAFLVASLRNTQADPILPGQASIYRDGVFLGRQFLDVIPAGGEADIPFGALEGIQLTYKALENDTGDEGIVTRSNLREQSVEFTVENLTSQAEDVLALFALPYSEQEDLEVRSRIRPAPSETDYEKTRGVGAWNLSLAPGAKITVRVDSEFSWPKGFALEWRP